MSRQIKKNRWITFPEDPEIQFLIRPFSILFLKTLPSDTSKITPSMMWDTFNSCVIQWKGLKDLNDEDLACNEVNKRAIAEHFEDILSFVFKESINKEGDITEVEVKN